MYKYFLPMGLALALAAPAQAQLSALPSAAAEPVQPGRLGHDAFRFAEPSSPLTLTLAIDLALEKNAALSAARYELDAVDAGVLQAGARPNPEIAALMEDTRRDSRSTTFQINQQIELGGKRDSRLKAANRAREIAIAEFGMQRTELRTAVTMAFFEVLIAQERRRLAQASATLAENGAGMAGRRVTAGKAPPLEETKAKVVQANARLELNRAVSELGNARKRLSGFWGNATPQFSAADGEAGLLPPLPRIDSLMRRAASAPGLRLARLEVARRQALSEVESSKRIPDLTVSLGSKRDEAAQRNMWVVGLSMPIPLFDSNRGNVLEALRRTDKARDQAVATEIRLTTEIAETYERLRNTREEADVIQHDILPAAQSAYDAASKGFQLGKFSFLDVLDAQRLLFQAKSQYLLALSETHRAAVELDRLTGPDIEQSEIKKSETYR